MTGYEYHRQTAYSRWSFGRRGDIRGGRPELFKRYQNVEMKRFPESLPHLKKRLGEAMFGQGRGGDTSTLDDGLLGLLLFLSYGIRPDSRVRGYPFRTVPSAGALYPCELYFFSGGIGRWEGGLYHYRADLHGAEYIAGGGGSEGCLEVKVSVLPYRSAFKYGERALRYVLLDAGHLIEQIRIAGKIVGLDGVAYSGCDDPLIWETAAGFNADHEVFIGGVRFGRPPGRVDIRPVIPPSEMRKFSEIASGGDYGRTLREVLNSIRRGGLLFDNDRVEDGESDLPDLDAVDTLLRRMSRRNYTGGTIRYDVFDIFLKVIRSVSGYSGPVVYTVVQSVEGLSPGVYLVKTDEKALKEIRSGSVMTSLANACLGQGWIASASFAVVIGLNARIADRAYGNEGYMHGMINAGRIGQRIYLVSEGLGLGCCGVGAFYDDDLSDVVSMDDDTYPVYVIPVGTRGR